MHDGLRLQKRIWCAFSGEAFATSRRMQNSFELTVGVGKERYVLWLPIMLPLFGLRIQTDKSGANYVFLQYINCTLALNEMDEDLGYVCPSQSTTDEKDCSTVAREEQNDRTELNVGE